MARQLTAPRLTEDQVTTTSVPEPAPVGLLERIWRRPLWNHAAALAVVLVALVPLIGPGASFSADEGAAIVQARHLSRGEGWIIDHPLPEADPAGRAYPLESSRTGAEGSAPFAKHPLYALMLAGADRLGGITAMVLLSLGGTLAAAAAAAALGGRLGPGLARPSLWVVGLATPLLFDGYVVIAHTLGAAAAAGAVLLAIRATETARPWLPVVGAAGCVAIAVLLRNEAMFLALGLGAALMVLAASRRSRTLAAAAALVVGVAAVAHLLESLWAVRIVGGQTVALAPGSVGDAGWLEGRTQAFVLTWLRPGYGVSQGAEGALAIMFVTLVVGALVARRRPDDRWAIVGIAAVATVASVAALAAGPAHLVPGLLVACPVAAAGLVLLRRSCLRPVGAGLALGTFTVFAIGVAATQYARGGSGEWGGRYFALGLPILVPVLLLSLARGGARLDRSTRRATVGALAVCSLATSVMGLGVLVQTHDSKAGLMAIVDRAGRETAGSGEQPVMLATNGAIPRFAWATFDRQRWLLSPPGDLAPLVARLRTAGVERAVLVTDEPVRDQEALGPGVEILGSASPPDGSRWRVVQLGLA